jgi:hypothetical protein
LHSRLQKRPVHLGVRIQDFHSWYRGSIPLRATTIYKKDQSAFRLLVFFNTRNQIILNCWFKPLITVRMMRFKLHLNNKVGKIKQRNKT